MSGDAAAAQAHPYAALLPETVLDAVEARGYRVSGSQLALNSYENRVYQVGLEDGRFLVAKFYRPGRLSNAAIREEHAFCQELAERDIPVATPLPDADGETLGRRAGFRFALYPRLGGHFPELEDPELLFRMGRLVGRIHAVGAVRPFVHRGRLDPHAMGRQAAAFLLQQGFIPAEHRGAYQQLTEALLDAVEARFRDCAPVTEIRLHGDFHAGNILQREAAVTVVDTDDCRMGPAVQDLWLMLSGEPPEMRAQLSELVEGYEEFHSFRRAELMLIEPLRTLRIINYAYWLALRWQDPAFPMHFPWFDSGPYWDEHIHTLQGQWRRMQDEPLAL